MKQCIFLLLVLLSLKSFSQQEQNDNSKTIDNQFETLYKKSSSYQEFKVISKQLYQNLHANVLDTVKQFHAKIDVKNSLINKQLNTISELEKEKQETLTKLNEAVTKENSISFFGLELNKTIYNLLLFFIIILLLVALGYFIFKFKNSNVITQNAIYNLEDVESEFEQFRKKTLEREQKLRRQLQDEIIKNRGN